MASQGNDWWRQNKETGPVFISSPRETSDRDVIDHRAMAARNCADEGVKAGSKAAAVVFVVTGIPTIAIARTLPWAKRNLNYTAQALIVSAASLATYFIVSDKTILKCAREKSYDKILAERASANRDT